MKPRLDEPPKFKRRSPAELSSGKLTPRPPSRTPVPGDYETEGRQAAAPSTQTAQVRDASRFLIQLDAEHVKFS